MLLAFSILERQLHAAAARVLRKLRAWTGGRQPISSIVQHNVEWDRLEEFGHKVSRIRLMELRALKMVDEVIAVSGDDRRRMVAAGIEEHKITVVPHGVDLRSYHQAEDRGAPRSSA